MSCFYLLWGVMSSSNTLNAESGFLHWIDWARSGTDANMTRRNSFPFNSSLCWTSHQHPYNIIASGKKFQVATCKNQCPGWHLRGKLWLAKSSLCRSIFRQNAGLSHLPRFNLKTYLANWNPSRMLILYLQDVSASCSTSGLGVLWIMTNQVSSLTSILTPIACARTYECDNNGIFIISGCQQLRLCIN